MEAIENMRRASVIPALAIVCVAIGCAGPQLDLQKNDPEDVTAVVSKQDLEQEAVFISRLMSDEPTTASEAARKLKNHGSPAAVEALGKRLRILHDKWKDRVDELESMNLPKTGTYGDKALEREIVDALLNGMGWHLGPEKLGELKELCLTEDSRRDCRQAAVRRLSSSYPIEFMPHGDWGTMSIEGYELRSLSAAKRKLVQFPADTVFWWSAGRPSRSGSARTEEVIREIKSFVESRGMKLNMSRAMHSIRAYKGSGTLRLSGSDIVDLTPMRHLPLKHLELMQTDVSDLSPLKDMPLEFLHIMGTKVADLSPLQGMPLRFLDARDTKVSDLRPLKGSGLRELALGHTKVTDISPLKGVPLTILCIEDTKVTDLSPIEGMPLTSLDFTPRADTKGLEIIAGMKTLQNICGFPVPEFWRSLRKEFPDKIPGAGDANEKGTAPPPGGFSGLLVDDPASALKELSWKPDGGYGEEWKTLKTEKNVHPWGSPEGEGGDAFFLANTEKKRKSWEKPYDIVIYIMPLSYEDSIPSLLHGAIQQIGGPPVLLFTTPKAKVYVTGDWYTYGPFLKAALLKK